MNILLTGGAGYIGSHACLSLLDAGHDVTVIDDLSSGYEQLIPKKAEFIKININNITVLNKILQKKSYDSLMHFAGFISVEESTKYPEKYYENNVKYSEILFRNCIEMGIKNIIFSSSATVYGNSGKKIIDEKTNLKPLNPYGESKAQAEKLLIRMQKENLINFAILRYFNVAGADSKLRSGQISKNPTHLIKIACEAAVGKRNSITIFGNDYNTKDGTAIRDYIHVTDLAEIHLKSMEYISRKNKSLIMNCGYGKGYSVKEILNAINKICNDKIIIKYGNRRDGDAASVVSDTTHLMKTINWKIKYNDIEKILLTAIEWEKKLINEKIF